MQIERESKRETRETAMEKLDFGALPRPAVDMHSPKHRGHGDEPEQHVANINARMHHQAMLRRRRGAFPRLRVLLPLLAALTCFLVILYGFAFGQGIAFWEAYTGISFGYPSHHRGDHALMARCRSLHVKAGPPRGFAERDSSDRWERGTKPVLVRNAKVWTGEKNGTEVVEGDILLDKGVVKGVGHTAMVMRIARALGLRDELEVVDARGAWVTPGYVSLHSRGYAQC